MKVEIQGNFIENGTYNAKDGQTVNYVTLLCDNQTLQVRNVAMPNKKYLEPVKIKVNLRAYQSQFSAEYIPN